MARKGIIGLKEQKQELLESGKLTRSGTAEYENQIIIYDKLIKKIDDNIRCTYW